MKKLFVVHSIDNIKKEEPRNIFECVYRKEIDKNISTLKFNENQLNINNSFQSTISNSSAESRKYSLNIPCQESSSSFVLNTSSNSNNKKKYKKKFLGKKVKFQFHIIKDDTDNMKNNESQNINKIIIKENEKNVFSIKDILTNIKTFNKNNHKEKIEIKAFLNEGRWSNEEHIKFIEALVKYGKNWKNIKKYIGTRTTTQARSHAQKFLLKLKMFKDDNSPFDFNSNNIKNLSNVIEEIKRKKNNNEDEGQYLINTLINLSETITRENQEFNYCVRKLKKKLKKMKKIKIEETTTDNNILNNDRKDLNNSNDHIMFNIELNQQDLKDPEKIEVTTENKYNNYESANEEKINVIKENNIKIEEPNLPTNDNGIPLFEDNSIKYNDYLYNSDRKLVVDDGVGYYLDDFDIVNYNNTSLRVKNYYFNIFFESSSIINKHFFS